jgi:hypothetical protein
LMWLLGFLTSGGLKSSCYGPTIYSWSEEGLHIQAVAYDIRSSTCTPFPHPPPAVMFMRFFRCQNELGCIVDVMHRSKILHFLLHPMIMNVIHKCLMQQCQCNLAGWDRWSWWCHHFANTCYQPTAVPRSVWFPILQSC